MSEAPQEAQAGVYRLSIRLLEKSLPPATAAFTAAAGYGVAGAYGMKQLRAVQPLFPAETARETVKTVADTTAEAARR